MKKNKKDKTEETDDKGEERSITDDVRGADYYHGLIPKADAEPMCKKEGDFLLRKTESGGNTVLAVTVRADNGIKNFIVNQAEDGLFYFETQREKGVADLITWHLTTKTPLSASSGARLKKAVERAPWALNHDSITLMKKLGEGAFGEVYLAEYGSGKSKQEVAVKTMRNEATREARLKFMKEARLMRKYNHRNVVKIVGVAVHEHPLMLVMEVCPGGSLVGYLRKNKGKLDAAEKQRFCVEAAEGLGYLASKLCIHRDIAARNCLLSAKNEVKIADFGMSDEKVGREIIQDDTLEKVPVKWLAPETLQEKIYSLKTDVWSFGILVWEVYAEGAEPYPGLTRLQTRAKIVVQNYRMEMPKDCPKAIADIVVTTWDKDPAKRPEMIKLAKMFREMQPKKT